MAEKILTMYLGVYANEADAQTDYGLLKRLHKAEEIGTYDAAIVSRAADGKVKVHRHDKPAEHGAWAGLVAGGMVGLIFPPAMIVTGAVGAAAGGAIGGHLRKGMSHGDLTQLGEEIDPGQAAMVIVSVDPLDRFLEELFERADRTITTELGASASDLAAAVDEHQAEHGESPDAG